MRKYFQSFVALLLVAVFALLVACQTSNTNGNKHTTSTTASTTTATHNSSSTSSTSTLGSISSTTTTVTQKSTTTTKSTPIFNYPSATAIPIIRPYGDLVIPSGTAYFKIALPGTMVDWLIKDDLIYSVFKAENCFMLVNAETGQVVLKKALPGVPGEVHLIGNEIFISLTQLKCIKVYSADTMEELRTLNFEHTVHSFDFYNDYVIYAETGQFAKVFRYNMVTNETEQIVHRKIKTFSNPDILVDAESGTFYLGESGSTGSELFLYEIETLTAERWYSSGGYGRDNEVRRILMDDEYVYWGGVKLQHNLQEKHIYINRVAMDNYSYPTDEANGILHITDNYVVTTDGIHLKSTDKQIVAADWDYRPGDCEAVGITKSEHFMMTKGNHMYIFLKD